MVRRALAGRSEAAMDTAPTIDPILCWPKGTENGQQTLLDADTDERSLAYRAV